MNNPQGKGKPADKKNQSRGDKAIVFTFQISPDRIHVQDKQTGYSLEVSNQVVYRQKDGMLLALGEPEEKARLRVGKEHEWESGEIHARSLFGEDGTGLRYELQALEHFTRELHHQSQRTRPVAHFAAKLENRFDYVLTIQDYGKFPEKRRNTLEQGIQAHLRLRRLVINGQEVQIPAWKRSLEFWLRRSLTLFIPLIAMMIGYLGMAPSRMANPFSFLAYLLLITYFFHYAGKIVWMVIAHRLVPEDYRMIMLKGVRTKLSGLDQYLARLIWGVDGTKKS